MANDNLILKLTFDFSLHVIEYTDLLQELKKFVVCNQVLKSGTSIGANVREAQGAESSADFKHKLKIAYKEASETEYWLELCEAAPSYPNTGNLLKELKSILNVLGKTLFTLSQRNN